MGSVASFAETEKTTETIDCFRGFFVVFDDATKQWEASWTAEMRRLEV